MALQKLTQSAIATRLASLNTGLATPWTLRDGALCKTFLFPDFPAAFAFMTQVALAAEKINHHPDWTNVWNRVEVRLSTHDAGGITELDFALAAAMERIA